MPRIFDKTFIPILGSMHLLMNCIGCVGKLMKNSGLAEVLESSFGSVTKMLSGKFFPQNLRAMRMVLEEVIRASCINAETYEELVQEFDSAAEQSFTSKLWTDCFF